MVLMKDEYESMKEKFLDLYREDIKSMLQEKKKQYLEYSMESVTLGYFFKNYMTGFSLILIFAVFALVKDIISIHTVIGFSILQLFIFSETYYEWKKDMRRAALNTFLSKIDSLVRDFIYAKMLEEIRDMSESEFERIVQFYCIALYDIPKNVMFMTFDSYEE